jgi:hypothetical protein
MSSLSKFAFASIAACLSAGVQADTVCSKPMLRNAYGFSGNGAGYTTLLPGGSPISCAVSGVVVFDANDGVTVKSLNEVCASNKQAFTLGIFNSAQQTPPTAGSYTLDAATCTAKIQMASVSGAFAFIQIVFTDNAQSFHMTFERTSDPSNVASNYGVAGSATGTRL